MIEISSKDECCGCSACFNICPANCIDMVYDEEGFLYPLVNKELCINCGLCEEVCPMLKTKVYDIEPDVYACKNKNKDIRDKSSSGGFFSVIANYVIGNNGMVYGAAFNDSHEVEHVGVDNKKDLQRLRGSKYVQSNTNDSFKQVKKFLKENRLVLFSGTPCQVAGLNNYLNKDYDNLITVDLVCHGVPSPGVFKKYLNYMEDKYNAKINDINFRTKELSNLKITFSDKKIYLKESKEDLYYKAFLSNIILRPSCYTCKHNNLRSGSDITIGDYWGVSSKFIDFDEEEGVSLVISKTKRGKDSFVKLNKELEYKKSEIEHAIKHNPCIIKSVPENLKRDNFFSEYKKDKNLIDKLLEKYINTNFMKDELVNIENKRVAIFGTGQVGQEVFDYLINLNQKKERNIKVNFFLDNNETMWNKKINSRLVLKPEKKVLKNVDLVIITSISGKRNMVIQLKKMGVSDKNICIVV